LLSYFEIAAGNNDPAARYLSGALPEDCQGGSADRRTGVTFDC
jgi:hypothetical protein